MGDAGEMPGRCSGDAHLRQRGARALPERRQLRLRLALRRPRPPQPPVLFARFPQLGLQLARAARLRFERDARAGEVLLGGAQRGAQLAQLGGGRALRFVAAWEKVPAVVSQPRRETKSTSPRD